MKKQSGITLIELMIAITLFAIVSTMGSVAYRDFVLQNQLATNSNLVVAHFRYARSEAVTRHARVTVCKSADQSTCSASGDWGQGWVIFVDEDQDGVRDTTEELLRVAYAQTGKVIGTESIKDYVSFDFTGNTRQVTGELQLGQLVFCESLQEQSLNRFIELLPTGRARVVKEAPASTTGCAVA